MKMMEKMYVRTNVGIAKVHSIRDNNVQTILTRNHRVGHYFTVLQEPSFNILDLIQIGDYVNNCTILDIVDIKDSKEKMFVVFIHKGTQCCKIWGEEDIETIVTKEQLDQEKYIIKKNTKEENL